MKVGKIYCDDLYTFYRYWLEIVCLKVNTGVGNDVNFPSGRQHHILTSKQMDLLAYLMRNRKQLEQEKSINDDDILDQLTSNESGRKRIRREMGITSQRLYELFKNMEANPFRIIIPVNFENGKLDYYRINPKYIPDLARENKMNRLADFTICFLKSEKPS